MYEGNGNCAAFLSNFEMDFAVRVVFRNHHYKLPPWSISILPDCKNVVFNTAKVIIFVGNKKKKKIIFELISIISCFSRLELKLHG